MTRGLVLSGGGSVGIAWQTGLAAGLAEAGVDLSRAETVVGTSAGSAVGAQIALGRDMREAMQRFTPPKESVDPARSAGSAPDRGGEASGPPAWMQDLMGTIAKVVANGGGAREVRSTVGRYALDAKTIPEEHFVGSFSYLAGQTWPASFSCTAVDVASGEFAVWNASSGVELPRAIASSCAVPGLFPPIEIRGRRYMDGGLRSGTNADLAKGCERVLLVSLMGRGGAGNAMREQSQRRALREREILEESGSTLELIQPDGPSVEAMGADLMNPRIAYEASQAGLRQGRAEAERLRTFWG